VWFTAGVKKSRPKIAYDVPQAAIRVEEFWTKDVEHHHLHPWSMLVFLVIFWNLSIIRAL
jgi:hypothetical protein